MDAVLERRHRGAASGRAAQAAELVPVAPLREAFHRSGLSLYEVAVRLGWTRPDGQRVGRALGLHARMNRGRRCRQNRVDYRTAAQLCEAIGVDPVDVDL